MSAYRLVTISGAPVETTAWRAVTLINTAGASASFPWELIAPDALEQDAFREIWINNSVVKSFDFVWTLWDSAGATLNPMWAMDGSVESAVYSDLPVSWNSDTSLVTSHELELYGVIQSDLDALWSIDSQAVIKYASFQWRMLTTVSQSKSLDWSMRKGVEASIGLDWLLDSPKAGSAISLPWSLNIPASASLSAGWSLAVPASQILSAQWNAIGIAAADLSAQWSMVDKPTATLNPQWNAVQLAQAELSVEWFALGVEPTEDSDDPILEDVDFEDRYITVDADDRLVDVVEELRFTEIR